jgi:ribonuclease T1
VDPRRRRLLTRAAIVALVAVSLWWFTYGGGAQEGSSHQGSQQSSGATASNPTATDPDSGLPWIERSQLPPEAIATLAEIDAGPPYAYDQDGETFQNREGILPQEALGYYEEFTVVTPGSSDRGARRIIAGAGGELYYTDDHYVSFSRIAP